MRKKGQPVVESVRIERMICYLRTNKEYIEEIEKGCLTFDFAGGKLRAKVEAFEEVKEKI